MGYEQIKIMEFQTENFKPVGSLRGAILKNDLDEKFLQLKLKNNSRQYLKEFTIIITCLDKYENELGVQEYTYNSLFIAPDEIFGTDIAVPLKYYDTESVKIEFKHSFDSINVKTKLINNKKINMDYLPLISGCFAVISGILYLFLSKINIFEYGYFGLPRFIRYFTFNLFLSALEYLALLPFIYYLCLKNKIERKWMNRISCYILFSFILGFFSKCVNAIKYSDFIQSKIIGYLIIFIIICLIYVEIFKIFKYEKNKLLLSLSVFSVCILSMFFNMFGILILFIDIALYVYMFKYDNIPEKIILGLCLFFKNLNLFATKTHISLFSQLYSCSKFVLLVIAIVGIVLLFSKRNINFKIKEEYDKWKM